MKAILSILLAVIPTMEAYACAVPATVERKLKQSDIVFVGRVSGISCDASSAHVEFEVHKIWKGELLHQYSLTFSKCAEARDLKSSVEYLVYAKADPERQYRSLFHFNTCANSVLPMLSREEEEKLHHPSYVDPEGEAHAIYWMHNANDNVLLLKTPLYDFTKGGEQ